MINLLNLFELYKEELTEEEIKSYQERISEVNSINKEVGGWIVSWSKTDRMGNVTPNGKYISGYLINPQDARHGHLITTAEVIRNETFEGFKVIYTNSLRQNAYFVLED